MKIYVVKRLGTLVPADEEAELAFAKIKIGETYRCEIRQPRSYQQHKLAMALLKLVYHNQDKYTNFDDLLTEIKLKTGHYREHITTKGKIIYVPRSISFASMDQGDFSILFEKMIDVVLRDFLPETDEAELREEIFAMVGS